jgi:hypothetical protein
MSITVIIDIFILILNYGYILNKNLLQLVNNIAPNTNTSRNNYMFKFPPPISVSIHYPTLKIPLPHTNPLLIPHCYNSSPPFIHIVKYTNISLLIYINSLFFLSLFFYALHIKSFRFSKTFKAFFLIIYNG